MTTRLTIETAETFAKTLGGKIVHVEGPFFAVEIDGQRPTLAELLKRFSVEAPQFKFAWEN